MGLQYGWAPVGSVLVSAELWLVVLMEADGTSGGEVDGGEGDEAGRRGGECGRLSRGCDPVVGTPASGVSELCSSGKIGC